MVQRKERAEAGRHRSTDKSHHSAYISCSWACLRFVSTPCVLSLGTCRNIGQWLPETTLYA